MASGVDSVVPVVAASGVAPVFEVADESCCCQVVVVAPVGEPTSGEGLGDCVIVEEVEEVV